MSRILILSAVLALTCCFQIKTDTTGESPAPQSVAAIPWPFATCGDGSWTIESLALDQAPKRNINDNIVTTGTAQDSITFKRAEITVKLNGVFLDKEVAEFTNSYDSGDSISFTYKNYIPGFAPSGTYGLTFQFIDSNEKPNGCLSFSFKL